MSNLSVDFYRLVAINFEIYRNGTNLIPLGYLDGRSAAIDKVSNEQKAYLFRTNYNLFNCAVQLIIDKGLKHVGFVGVR